MRIGHLTLLCLAVVTGAAVLALAWGWWAYPLPDGSDASRPVVYLDSDGREIATFHGVNGRYQVWLPLDRIPPIVVAAVIAAEDRRFKLHLGVDFLAVARAALTNAREGDVVRGASTITQQLARGLFLTRERTWARKVREIAIALLLERRYSKERILEAYLNTVYLGQERDAAVLGVAAGDRHLLGKDVSVLRLDEAALLAAAIRAPNRVYSDAPALVRARRDRVLDAMVAQGIATEREARFATARPLRPPTAPPSRAPWFIELAREEAARRVIGGLPGVRLTTSLDRALPEGTPSGDTPGGGDRDGAGHRPCPHPGGRAALFDQRVRPRGEGAAPGGLALQAPRVSCRLRVPRRPAPRRERGLRRARRHSRRRG